MTWTDQGLALRQALDEAVRRAHAGGVDRLPLWELEEILTTHPVDEAPNPVTVVVFDPGGNVVRFDRQGGTVIRVGPVGNAVKAPEPSPPRWGES